MKHSRLLALTTVAALMLGAGWYAKAQIFPAPPTPPLHQTDLIIVAPQGNPSVPGSAANPGMLGGMRQYSYQIPVTGFSITVPDNVNFLLLNPAGTLATGTITFPANPGDGEQFCWVSTQTQTGITMTANTAQALAGATVSAGVAYTEYCWTWIGKTSTWYHTLDG